MKIKSRFLKLFNQPIKGTIEPYKSRMRTIKMPDIKQKKWWEYIEKKHNEQHRRYHNQSHLESLFKEYDKAKVTKPQLIENCGHLMAFTIFFHDIIYKVGNEQNEMESAATFMEFAKDIEEGLMEYEIEFVTETINGTKNHTSRTKEEIRSRIMEIINKNKKDLQGIDQKQFGELMVDAFTSFLDWDLAILGKNAKEYEQYAMNIREEYKEMKWENYYKGRAAFLQTLLGKQLYFTKEFQKYEKRAYQNISKEIRTMLLPEGERKKKILIGLTGGICAGKSTGRKILKDLGASITIDADKVGHKIYEPGKPAYYKVIEHFGEKVIDQDDPKKHINRRVLGSIVFAEKKEMRALEAIVWPAIQKEVMEMANQVETGVVIIEAAILVEAGWDKIMDETWCYAIPKDVAIERMVSTRGLNKEQAASRLNSQLSNEERIKHATRVFWTDKPIENQRKLVGEAWKELQNILIPMPNFGVSVLPPFKSAQDVEPIVLQAENLVNKGVYYILTHYPTVEQLIELYTIILNNAPAHLDSTVLLPPKCDLQTVIDKLPFINEGNFEIFDFHLEDTSLCQLSSKLPNLNVSTIHLMSKVTSMTENVAPSESFERVCVGGTFDRLHIGHRLLLSALVLRAKESQISTLVIGITKTELQEKKAFKDLIEPFDIRVNNVKRFIDLFNAGQCHKGFNIEIAPLEEPFGPTITDAEIKLLVVSEETKKGGEKIIDIRKEKQLPPLQLQIIPEIKSEGSSIKISSSALRQQDANRNRL